MGKKNRQPPRRLFRQSRPEPSDGPRGMTMTAPSPATIAADPAATIRGADRTRIVQAVRKAVATIQTEHPAGLCIYSNSIGYYLLTTKLRVEAPMQGGSLLLLPDPADPTLGYEINARADGIGRGEFHAWLATSGGWIIDFAAPDYPGMVNGQGPARMTADEARALGGPVSAFAANATAKTVDDVMTYRRPVLDVLWSPWNALPEFVRLTPDMETIRGVRLLARTLLASAEGKMLCQIASMAFDNPDMLIFV
jgi:hypothetical protein